jgi:DNA-binding Lrp family transcriptional regulator
MTGKTDATDRAIVDYLATTPRARNAEIGARLSLAPSFVSARIRSMVSRGTLWVTAFHDARLFGYSDIARVQIRVAGADPEALAHKLADNDRVLSVDLTTGEFQISALLGLKADERLTDFTNELLADLKGVVALRCQPIRTLFRGRPGLSPKA